MTCTKRPYNSAGEGWPYLAQLDAADSSPIGEGRQVPEVRLQEKLEAATVIRISFRDGDEMADHHAPSPILVLGQSGKARFTVSGSTMTVAPSAAVQVDAGVVHSLRADDGPAVVTLVFLTSH